MEKTPDLVKQQKERDLNILGMQTNWADQALSKQVRTLKSAIAKLHEERVPQGSRLRAFLVRECTRVSKSILESSSAHGSSSGHKLIGSGHRDPSPDAPQGANKFVYTKKTLEKRRQESTPTSGLLSSGLLERFCHICKQRSDYQGQTRKRWFACGYCLEGNEKGIRPFYGVGTGKGRGKDKGYASDEDLEEHAHKGARKGKGCSTEISEGDKGKGKDKGSSGDMSDDDKPKGKGYHGDGAAGMDAAAPCGHQAAGSSQQDASGLPLQRKRRKTAHCHPDTDEWEPGFVPVWGSDSDASYTEDDSQDDDSHESLEDLDTEKHGEPSPAPENTSPPFTTPEEFGFTKKLLKHMGLNSMTEAACLVNVLRLPLDATEDEVKNEIMDAFAKLEGEESGEQRAEGFWPKLHVGTRIIRNQMRNSEEYLRKIPRSGMQLTKEDANWWMSRIRSDFEDTLDQKDYRSEDRERWRMCARQVDQRQGSRYNAYMVRTFGGQNCLKRFFLTRSWTDRRLPKHLEPEASTHRTRRVPIKMNTNRNRKQQADARTRYFQNVKNDIEYPHSVSAQGRYSKYYARMQIRADRARKGEAFFHDKGGDKIEVHWTGGLVKVGLNVGPCTSLETFHEWQTQENQRQWQMASWWPLDKWSTVGANFGSGHHGAWCQWPTGSWWTRG